jgi:hypothetical protein
MQLHKRAHSREENKVTKAASIKVSIAAHNFSTKIILKEIRRILEPKTRALLQGHLQCVQGE